MSHTALVDAHDRALLDLCHGPTLDIGCGDGRLARALSERGVPALGIDVGGAYVDGTLARGGTALHRDVFGPVPGEGRWATVLLADGSIGIGADPAVLLARVRELLDPRGRAVVDVAAPGVPAHTAWRTGADRRSVARSVVGLDDIGPLSAAAALRVAEVSCHGGRWCVVLVRDDADRQDLAVDCEEAR